MRLRQGQQEHGLFVLKDTNEAPGICANAWGPEVAFKLQPPKQLQSFQKNLQRCFLTNCTCVYFQVYWSEKLGVWCAMIQCCILLKMIGCSSIPGMKNACWIMLMLWNDSNDSSSFEALPALRDVLLSQMKKAGYKEGIFFALIFLAASGFWWLLAFGGWLLNSIATS